MPSIPLFFLPLFLGPALAPAASISPALEPATPCARATSQGGKVDELLAQGREHLAAGRTEEALRAFGEADQLSGGALATRVFVLRARMARDPIEDVMLAIDELAPKHKGTLEVDYLYGMGFYSMASLAVSSGQTTSVTGSQFEDALRHLARVTAKADRRFDDAWSATAECSWFTQDFARGRPAADKAIELAPNDPWKRLLRGRLGLAAFAAWQADETRAADAESEWVAAVEALEKAVALCGPTPEARQLGAAQQALVQLGTAHLWKNDRESAQTAYRRSIVLDPASADYAAISAALSPEELGPVLEGAHKSWKEKHGEAAATTATDATLLWWLGYSRYGAKSLAEAGQAFELAFAKNPRFTNCLYYLFRVEYERREFGKSLAALRKYEELSTGPDAVDPGGLTGALAYDVAGNTARLEGLIGWAMGSGDERAAPRNLDAAFACELITRIVTREPENSRHWNNLGLFLRDEGDRIRGTQGALGPAPAPYDEAKVLKLWEDALVAYETALELEPKNPNYLNDTAVMLHYYLVRDLERAKVLYQRGFEEATELLKRTDLSPDVRDVVKIALRDTGNNVRLVQKLIEKRAAEAAAKNEKPTGG